jgi:hypothetical protein
MASACDAVESCDGVAAECPVDVGTNDGGACDDSDPCTVADVCGGGVCEGELDLDACTDDFSCYKSKVEGFAELPIMTLSDLQVAGVEVLKATQICAVADRDAEGIADPTIQLMKYQIKTEPGFAKPVPTTMVMRNDLGDISIDTGKPDLMLVPSAIGSGTAPPAPDFGSHGVDHYRCYRAKLTKDTTLTGPAKGTLVSISDAFTTTKNVEVKKVKRLCVPTDREGDGIKNADGYLLCYQSKSAKGQPKHVRQQGVLVVNPQSDLSVATTGEAEICLPSQRLP